MNIVLFLNKALSEAISLYLTDVLKLSEPICCKHTSQLDELYKKLRPVIIITELDYISEEPLKTKLAEVIKPDVQSRMIVLSGKPIVSIDNKELIINDKKLSSKLCEAVKFYLNTPDRLIFSMSVVADYDDVRKPEPQFSINTLNGFSDIKWGQYYLIVDKNKNKLYRTIHPSPKRGYLTLKIDKLLTPKEHKRKPVIKEIAWIDIREWFGIGAEFRAF